MDSDQLRTAQAPLKARYRDDPIRLAFELDTDADPEALASGPQLETSVSANC
jgi:hypothetical protein